MIMANSGIAFGLGPFSRGLSFLNPLEISNQHLSECLNFDVEIDGTLKSRVGLKEGGTIPGVGLKFLGIDDTIVFALFQSGSNFIIGMTTDQGATWSNIFSTTTGKYAKAIRYGAFVYFVPETGATGKRWDGAVLTDVAAIPVGIDALIFKERLWVIQGATLDRVYYSAVTDPTSFPGANFFDVNPRSNGKLSAIKVYQDSLILFKETGTWRFDFNLDPGTDGYLQKVNSEIGIQSASTFTQFSSGVFSATTINDEIYTINRDSIYRYVNGNFENIGLPLSRLAPLSGGGNPSFYTISSLFPNKLWISTGAGPFIYHIDSGAWSKYAFLDPVGNAIGDVPPISVRNASGTIIWVFLNNLSTLTKSHRMEPFNITPSNYVDFSNVEIPKQIKTKQYDAEDPLIWKKLYWFGIEVEALSPNFGTSPKVNLDVSINGGAYSLSSQSSITEDLPVMIKSGIGSRRFRTCSFGFIFKDGNVGFAGVGSRVIVHSGRMVVNHKTRLQKVSTP